jgi:putative FmdB family regulatory protein
MPTYEYECEACGHAFERFQSMRDEPIRTCPECGGAVRRLISSGGGLVFKGPGFYATDYRSGPAGRETSTRGKPGDGAKSESGTRNGEAGGVGGKAGGDGD